jgi:predicted transcriptional regulator
MKRFAYLRGAIMAAGYENRDVAQKAGCSETHFSRVLNAKADPTLSLQYRIVEVIKGDPEKMHLYFPKNGIA